MLKKIFSVLICMAVLSTAVLNSAFAAQTEKVITGNFTFMPAFSENSADDTFFYSDGYFTEDSATDNAHRTSMSMALALSTIEIGGSSYVTKLFSDIGFSDIEIGDMNDKPTKDTIGTAIAHKSLEDTELIAVAIRGSKYDAEWASNLTVGDSGDISGIESAAEKVKNRLLNYIEKNNIKTAKIWITGYSRAGAVADLLGVYINENLSEFKTEKSDLFVYTFEAPAASKSDKIYENIHSIRNKNDVINYVYPKNWGVYSNGVDQIIGEDKTLTAKIFSLFGEEKIIDLKQVQKDEFLKEFIDFLSNELTRAEFSGDFDGTVSKLIETVFDKTPEERNAIVEYVKSAFSGDLMKNEAFLQIAADDIYFGILEHNSDKMYERLANDIKTLFAQKYTLDKLSGVNVPLTAEDLSVLSDSLYPILRQLGPVLVSDFYYHEGKSTEDFYPEYYFDSDYDPNAWSYEDEETETDLSDEEQGAKDGEEAAFVGWDDGYNGNKYASYNDVPEDAEDRSEEYLSAYKEAYKQAYELQYEDGANASIPTPDDEYGRQEGNYAGEESGKEDSYANNPYGTSYDDTPIQYGDEPYSEEFIKAYKDAYKDGYDIGFAEKPLYYFATFALNFNDIWSEHQHQVNWEYVKALDSYYTEGVPEYSEEIEEPEKENAPDEHEPSEQKEIAQNPSDKTENEVTTERKTNYSIFDSNPSTGVNGTFVAVMLIMAAGTAAASKKK